MRWVDLCFAHPQTGHQGVKIPKTSFGAHKRIWVFFIDEKIEASKIIVIYLFIGGCFVMQTKCQLEGGALQC